jgi:hypothetical protein
MVRDLAERYRSVYSPVDTRYGCTVPRETSPRSGWSREDYGVRAAYGRMPAQPPSRAGRPDESQ